MTATNLITEFLNPQQFIVSVSITIKTNNEPLLPLVAFVPSPDDLSLPRTLPVQSSPGVTTAHAGTVCLTETRSHT